MSISKAKHIITRSMSRYLKHKRHQYNDGKPRKGKKTHQEKSFLYNDRTSTRTEMNQEKILFISPS